MLFAVCRYTATDHKSFDQTLKHCPAGAFCRNCMPINDTADHCWPVKTPILYKIKSYGKIEAKNKADIVSPCCIPCDCSLPAVLPLPHRERARMRLATEMLYS